MLLTPTMFATRCDKNVSKYHATTHCITRQHVCRTETRCNVRNLDHSSKDIHMCHHSWGCDKRAISRYQPQLVMCYIARLRYAANLEACSLYERGPHDIFTQPCCPIVQSQALPKKTSLTSLSSRPFPPNYLQLLQGVQEKDICFCLASRCAFMRTPASEEA